MGKEVTYCESCGHRLMGDAFIHDGRTFCDACRPTSTVPVVTAPARRPSSGRLPRVPARRTKESTRIRRKRNFLVPAIGVAAAAALAVGIAVASSGSPEPVRPKAEPAPVAAPPVPKAEPKQEAGPSPDEILARVRGIRESDLMFERRDEVLKLLRRAAGHGEADRLAAEYEAKFEDAAARLADFARSEALRLAGKQKYAEAISSLDGYPAAFRTSRSSESLGTLRRDLERRRAQPAGTDRAPARTPPGTSPILPLIAGRKRSS